MYNVVRVHESLVLMRVVTASATVRGLPAYIAFGLLLGPDKTLGSGSSSNYYVLVLLVVVGVVLVEVVVH